MIVKLATYAMILLLIGGALFSGIPPTYATSDSDSDVDESPTTNTNEGSDETPTEPTPEPEPSPTDNPPAQTDEPVAPRLLTPTEQEDSTVTCPDGVTEVIDMDDCPKPLAAPPVTESLPPECAEGTTALECLGDMLGEPDCGDLTPLQCLEDKLKEDNNESPLVENGTSPLQYPSPDVEVDVEVGDNETDPGNGNGNNQTDPGDEPHPCKGNNNGTLPDYCDKDKRKERHDHFKKIVHNINVHTTIINQDEFPDVDIIGLSIKDNGAAMVCFMNIDNDNVQCQEFGVPDNRINDNVWRIIETDKDDDFDDGNTGSDDVDDAIAAIKSYDFTELEDIDNHDFNVDLAALGINPEGEGLICLIEDNNDDDSTALCEPFKVDSAAISGQITEITEIDS